MEGVERMVRGARPKAERPSGPGGNGELPPGVCENSTTPVRGLSPTQPTRRWGEAGARRGWSLGRGGRGACGGAAQGEVDRAISNSYMRINKIRLHHLRFSGDNSHVDAIRRDAINQEIQSWEKTIAGTEQN